MELEVAKDSLGLAPICVIKGQLDRIFGSKEWNEWSLETMSIGLGIIMDELLRDKITLLQTLEINHNLFYDNVLFCLHSAEVLNNKVADFETIPFPNSLELAYAIHEMKKVYPGDFKYPVKKALTYVLKNEGYSKAVGIFKGIVFEDELAAGQEASDTRDKEEAIKLYIKGMDNDY